MSTRTCIASLLLSIAVLCVDSRPRAQSDSSPGQGGITTTQALTAREILRRMANAYGTFSSYKDEGTVIIDNSQFTGAPIEWLFKTAFVRPDRFRFEFEDRQMDQQLRDFNRMHPEDPGIPGHDVPKKCIVWKDGTSVLGWWYVEPGIRTEESLDLAIAGATAVTGGAALTIPSLLMPKEIGGGPFAEVKDEELLGNEVLDGNECYRIRCVLGEIPERTEVWIEQRRFVILKTFAAEQRQSGTWTRTTRYRPTINEPIPGKELRFDPPADSPK